MKPNKTIMQKAVIVFTFNNKLQINEYMTQSRSHQLEM